MSKKISFEVSDEEEKAVFEAIQPYRAQITATPELLSLLYDIDLLPEQIPHMANAIRMITICELMKQRDEARISALGGNRRIDDG